MSQTFPHCRVHAGSVYIGDQTASSVTGLAPQTQAVLANIDALLAGAGTSRDLLVCLSITLQSYDNRAQVESILGDWLANAPRRPVLATTQANLAPEDHVKIAATAALPSQVVETADAAGAVGPYNQAIVENGYIYGSGCIGLSPTTGQFVGDTIEEQTEQVLSNLWAIMRAGGATDPSDIVKTTILLDDINDFAAVNKIYANFFGAGRVPARSTFAAKSLPKGAKVEIEAFAKVTQTQ